MIFGIHAFQRPYRPDGQDKFELASEGEIWVKVLDPRVPKHDILHRSFVAWAGRIS